MIFFLTHIFNWLIKVFFLNVAPKEINSSYFLEMFYNVLTRITRMIWKLQWN